MRSGSRRQLPEAVHRQLGHADVVLHAGDVLDHSVLAALASYAPTHAVLGNNDVGLAGVLPETRVVDVGGVAVAMIHDSGPRTGRERRMQRRFPGVPVVVFGHSHIPWNAAGLDGQLLFNPGSPTDRRRQPHCTMGLLECDDGLVVRHDIVVV
ncbi:MAG: metallophosphoesterase family protein [Actinobacteria bacterium]|nr:metallophosphoesterase family protein [Actinomycetota bacterium]